MALRDKACYTLNLIPSLKDPTIIELVENLTADKEVEAKYVRVREDRDGEVYSSVIYDAFSGARLAEVGCSIEKGKRRRLGLFAPDEEVGFEFTGRLNFEWTFTFEGNKYRWSRDLYGKDYICSLDRKPDPKVEICLAREAEKTASARLQILHYNIDRFPDEIKDLRGLETLLVATLLCFIDTAEDRASKTSTRPALTAAASGSSGMVIPPPVPVRVISQEDFEPENPNEILVTTRSNLDNHIARAINLLEDKSVLFIVIRSKTAEASQRALEVSLGITRYRHREELSALHQYVIEEDPPSTPGPKVIKLDEQPRTSRWTPPPNLAIYLSTIELPDLKPGRRETMKSEQASSNGVILNRVGSGNGSPGAVSPETGGEEVPGRKVSRGHGHLGKLFRHKS